MHGVRGAPLTFLLSDIEGSTRLWEEHPEATNAAIARHGDLAAELVSQHGGTLVKRQGEGDSLFAVFPSAADAVAAACALQSAFASEVWPTPTPLRVRLALHTGEALVRDGDYYGSTVNRCARLRAAAHGGQTLLTRAVQELVGDSLPPGARLKDLGDHRLRDLSRPDRVFQLLSPGAAKEFPPIRSLESHANNLPGQLTSFVGRERDLLAVRELLGRTRLLTLTGSGGTGKTRLALQLAAGVLDDYGDGVWLIELAALSDPALVPRTVATVLTLPGEPGLPLTDALIERLRSSRALLVMDNCEHVLSAVASLVETLLRACPDLRVLASSREGLNIPGEATYRVPSMSLPDAGDPTEPERLLESEAVRLFVERAHLYQPRFALTPENAGAVSQVCLRLDGIPLALELAAARLRSLSVEEICARLDDRFRLLTGGSRTALPRQQTLRALIDWSYYLLSEPEQVLLRRLSVFRGGWTLEAAECVCSGIPIEEGAVLDVLTYLVEKSLVITEDQAGSTRYALLETVRQYAGDRLMECGEGVALRTRAAEFFVGLAERERLRQYGPDQRASIDRVEADHDNLRAAAEWFVSEPGGVEMSLRLVGALIGVWVVRGHYQEGLARAVRALALPGADRYPHPRAQALAAAGLLCDNRGDLAAARAYYGEALELSRSLHDVTLAGRILNNLAVVARKQRHYAEGQQLAEEALRLFRQAGDRGRIAWLLANLSAQARLDGDLDLALARARESLALHREQDFAHGIAFSLHQVADVLLEQGDLSGSRAAGEESLQLFRHIGQEHGIASSTVKLAVLALREDDVPTARRLHLLGLEGYWRIGLRSDIEGQVRALAHLAAEEGTPQGARAAARFYGAAETLREAVGAGLSSGERDELEGDRRLLTEALGADLLQAEWAAGRRLTTDQAVGEVARHFAEAEG
jgi:predicted ATPase/class 3 adenylate cyclase